MIKCKQCEAPLEPSVEQTIRIAVTPGSLDDHARLCSWKCAVNYCEEQGRKEVRLNDISVERPLEGVPVYKVGRKSTKLRVVE